RLRGSHRKSTSSRRRREEMPRPPVLLPRNLPKRALRLMSADSRCWRRRSRWPRRSARWWARWSPTAWRGPVPSPPSRRGGPRPAVGAGRTALEEIQTLKENVVQARVELAALKLSIDSANRNAGAQLTRISERIDRVERSQAEPAAKLTKAIDTPERLARGEAA